MFMNYTKNTTKMLKRLSLLVIGLLLAAFCIKEGLRANGGFALYGISFNNNTAVEHDKISVGADDSQLMPHFDFKLLLPIRSESWW
jgi:hypothetical protein